MRKLIVLLALIGASAFFVGALPATAGAANCNASAGYSTLAADSIRYTAGLYNCTDVSQVQFVRDNFQCPSCPHSGWADNTLQQWIMGGFRGWPGLATVTDNIPADGAGAQETVIRTCWWGGYAQHNLVAYFIFRIKGRASGTWGPLHDVYGPASYPACP